MEAFGTAALFGLILGFMFGVGCAAAVLYSIWMSGYRRGVRDSSVDLKSERFQRALRKVEANLPRK
jgi:hypothetical protein